MKINLIRNENSPTLKAVYSDDLEKLKTLKHDTVYSCTTKEQRNPSFNAKYHVLLKIVFDNLPEDTQIVSKQMLKEDIKIRLGYARLKRVEYPAMQKVVEQIEFDSFAFEYMDDLEFQEVYSKTVDLVCSHYLKGVEPEAVYNMIGRFM